MKLEAGWDRSAIQNIVQSVRKHHFSSQLSSPAPASSQSKECSRLPE